MIEISLGRLSVFIFIFLVILFLLLFSFIKKIVLKYREIVSYLIVGILTTIVSLGIYYILVFTLLNPDNFIELQITNIISWTGAVLFAYVTNRIFVFKSKSLQKKKEFVSFVGSRVLTLLLDMLIMFLGVSLWHFNDKIIKLVSQVFITIANYILSKFLVFKKEDLG